MFWFSVSASTFAITWSGVSKTSLVQYEQDLLNSFAIAMGIDVNDVKIIEYSGGTTIIYEYIMPENGIPLTFQTDYQYQLSLVPGLNDLLRLQGI